MLIFAATMYQAIRALILSDSQCWDADSKRSCQELFEKLDTNKDGKVDIAELRAGLTAMGVFRQGAAQVNALPRTSRMFTDWNNSECG